MWNVISFTFEKAGKGRTCRPVVIYTAFTFSFFKIIYSNKYCPKAAYI